MAETIDVTTWLIFLAEWLSDDAKREELISRISASTGISREHVATVLDATPEALAEYLPAQ